MRTFVDLGHLRPTDLIWRAGFSDWRAAPEVFVIHSPAQPELLVPYEVPQDPRPAAADAAHEAIVPVEQIIAAGHLANAAAAANARVTNERLTVTGVASTAQSFTPQELTSPADLRYTQQGSRSDDDDSPAAYGDSSQNRLHQPVSTRASSQPQGPTRQPAGSRPTSERVAGARRPPAQVARGANLDFGLEDEKEARPSRGRRRVGLKLVAGMSLLLLLAGGGAVAFMKREQLLALLPTGGSASKQSGTAMVALSGGSAETVDDAFQRLPIWRHIKLEFPEWYAERVQEAVKFASENRSETVITKHLAEAVVSLRRKHAEQALTASPERLKFVATAFLDNLQALAKQNVETCYGFISQGETYPAVLEMLQKQSGSEPLQKQVIAVFEAISDGRKTPQSYLPPRKADYDALAAELTARGWTEADLRTFSDPRALGKASPQQVCKMVQDWFAAQIAIKDPAAQLRLLVESLRPVVAG